MTTFLDMDVTELPNTHKLCYIGDCSFTRSSVAYDYLGREIPANQPRFTHRVVDTTVTNLLTGNQSDVDSSNPELLTLNQRTGTDTLGDTTGFSVYTNATLSSTTEESHSGTRSLKIVSPGDGNNNGFTFDTPTVNGTTYTFGMWFKAPAGTYGNIYESKTNTGIWWYGNGDWQWIELSLTANYEIVTFYIGTYFNTTWYVDDLRFAKNVTTGWSAEGGSTISISGEDAYRGYRSLKVVCTANGQQALLYLGSGGTGNTTTQARIKGTAGKTVTIRQPDQTTWITHTFTGGWDLTYGTGAGGPTPYLVIRSNSGAQTFFIDSVMMETSSVLHDWAYGTSSYSTYKIERGCLVEEAHENLLTANQSTAGDTSGDTAGFSSNGTGTATTVSTTEYYQGTKSIKTVTTGLSAGEGSYCVPVVGGGTFTFSCKVKADKGVPFYLGFASGSSKYTGTGEWQDCSVTVACGAGGQWAGVFTLTQQATTFYIDMLQLINKPIPLSWTLGNTTQEAEEITAPINCLNMNEEDTSLTIECEAYLPPSFEKQFSDIFFNIWTIRGGETGWGQYIECYLTGYSSELYPYIDMYNPTDNSYSYLDIPLEYAYNKISFGIDSEIMSSYVSGTKTGDASIATLFTPLVFCIGSYGYVDLLPDIENVFDGIIRNFVVSNIKRDDSDVTARATANSDDLGFPVDENCTLIFPLKKDLSAYRVVTK